jgi:hypothetical protein
MQPIYYEESLEEHNRSIMQPIYDEERLEAHNPTASLAVRFFLAASCSQL